MAKFDRYMTAVTEARLGYRAKKRAMKKTGVAVAAEKGSAEKEKKYPMPDAAHARLRTQAPSILSARNSLILPSFMSHRRTACNWIQ